MKYSTLFCTVAAIVSFISCSKEIVSEDHGTESITKTFYVSVPETKTTIDGVDVKWSSEDKITVVAATTGNKATFSLISGANTPSAVFEGTIDPADASETTFYAVYPNIDFTVSETTLTLATSSLPSSVNAVEGGYDTRNAVLIATNEGDSFSFKHGSSYIKFKVGDDNVSSITFTANNTKFTGTKISYNLSDLTYATIAGTTSSSITISGAFAKGKTYYVPIMTKSSNVKTFTVDITYADSSTKQLSNTTAFTSVKFQNGHVYNIGTLTTGVRIIADSPDPITYNATSGEINYSITDSGTLTNAEVVAYTETGYDALTVSNITISATKVSFTVPENDGVNPRMAKIRLSYTGADDVDVIISQNAQSTIVTNTYTLYMNSSGKVQKDSYFTSSSGNITLSSSADNGCGVDSFTIEGVNYTNALKLDGSGHVTFTTNATLNASVTFYYSKRKSGSGSIKITPTGGSATVYSDANYGSLSSQTLTLSKSTEYKIERNDGELALVYVKVVETNQ